MCSATTSTGWSASKERAWCRSTRRGRMGKMKWCTSWPPPRAIGKFVAHWPPAEQGEGFFPEVEGRWQVVRRQERAKREVGVQVALPHAVQGQA